MNKRFDVVVVGAGPAGLMAAKTAGENGLEVALLEQKTNLTTINRTCAMMVLVFTEYYYGDRLAFDARNQRIIFPVHGFSIPYKGPYTNLYAWNFYSPDGHCLRLGDYEEARKRGDDARLSMVIDKEVLLEGLLHEAEGNGVEAFPGHRVTNIESVTNGVRVITLQQSFEATYVIAADGVNTTIGQRLGFNQERTFYCTLTGTGCWMEGMEMAMPEANNVFIGEQEEPVYNFIYPKAGGKGGEFLVFNGGFNPQVNYPAALDHFISESPFSHWFKNAKKGESNSYLENVYSPLSEPFHDNVLLIGDAAWCQEIENMAAILCGWKAAQTVTLALTQKRFGKEGISPYLEWWKKTIINSYDHSQYLRGTLLPVILTRSEINYLFSLFEEPLPGTLNPYTAGQFMSGAIQQLMPRIAEEKPGMILKLLQFMSAPVESLLGRYAQMGYPNQKI